MFCRSSVARADICPKIGRPRLQHTKGLGAKIREQYGYEIKSTTYLYAEEALYLIEIVMHIILCLYNYYNIVLRSYFSDLQTYLIGKVRAVS